MIKLSSLSPYYTIFTALIILILAYHLNTNYSRPTVRQINNGHSMSFRNRHIPDPMASIKPEEIQHQFTRQLTLNLPEKTTSDLITLGFFYHCNPCQFLFINAQYQNQPAKIWIHHPQLANLNWFRINLNNGFYLYQRNPQYTSLDQLESNPPSTLVADQLFTLTHPDIPVTKFTTDFDPQQDQYLITTYLLHPQIEDWYFFSTPIKTTWLPNFNSNSPQLTLTHEGDAPVSIARKRYRVYNSSF